MYIKFELKKLRRVVCSGDVLAHSFCSTRSYASLEVPCCFCSHLWVKKAKFFRESVVYCFGSLFSANQFNSDIVCLFSAHRKHSLSLKCIWPSTNLILMFLPQN